MLDIKQIAVGRLMLDNFPHIKSYWQMVTPKMAQISLRFGADDIDGTVVEEKIYHDAGATTPQGMRRADLVRLITEAGRVPFERDTMYRAVTRSEDYLYRRGLSRARGGQALVVCVRLSAGCEIPYLFCPI